jgi:hypothetical protein
LSTSLVGKYHSYDKRARTHSLARFHGLLDGAKSEIRIAKSETMFESRNPDDSDGRETAPGLEIRGPITFGDFGPLNFGF